MMLQVYFMRVFPVDVAGIPNCSPPLEVPTVTIQEISSKIRSSSYSFGFILIFEVVGPN